MSRTSGLAAALRIRPGEGPVASRLLLLMLVAWSGAAVGSTAVETLFFSQYGAANLPGMFVALGIVTFPVTLGVSALLSRFDRRRVLAALPFGLAAVTLLLRLALTLDGRWVFPVLWITMMVIWIVLAMDTWGLAGLVHDPRQSKRLFPLYGAGVILGGAIGGLVTGPLAGWIGVENLLLVWGLSLVAAGLIASRLPGRTPARSRRGRSRQGGEGILRAAREGVGFVGRSPLLRRMSLAILLCTLLYYVLSLPFAEAVTARFSSPDRLAAFLGAFSAATNGAALVLSLLVANRLLSRLGVATAVVVLPAVYVVGFSVLVATGSAFAPLAGFRFVQWVWMYGVWSIGWQALWGVVPPEWKQQARAFVDGGPTLWGVLLAGVLLLVAERVLTDRVLFGVAAVIGAGAVVAAWSIRPAYRAALDEAVRAGWPDVFVADEEPFGGVIADPAAHAALVAALDEPDPSARRVAVQILAMAPAPGPEEAARRGLADPDPVVREAALGTLARPVDPEMLPRVLELLRDEDATVRSAATRALGGSQGEDVARAVRPLLADPDPSVRAAAAGVDMPGGLDGAAERVVRDLAASDDPEQRALAVTTLGSLGRGRDVVLALLGDPEPAVRRTAVRAVASFGTDVAIDPLLDALADDDPTVSQAAADAVVRIDGEVGDRLVPLLHDPMRASAALDALVRLPDVRAEVLRSFAVDEQGRALRYHGHWRAASTADEEEAVLLAAGLRNRALRHAAQAVRALAGPSDREAVELDLESAVSRDPAQRAYALEQLEGSGDARVIRPLLEVWEPVPARRPFEAAALRPMLEDDDPWIRACAAFAARGFPDASLGSAVRALARDDPDPVVRDAASWAMREDGVVETVSTVSLLDRVMALGRVPLFRELSPEDLKHVAESLVENAYPDGSLIAVQGEAGAVMHVVVSGEIRVLRHGDEVELARRGPGYIVGEMAILTGEPRMADLLAVGEVRTLSIDQPTIPPRPARTARRRPGRHARAVLPSGRGVELPRRGACPPIDSVRVDRPQDRHGPVLRPDRVDRARRDPRPRDAPRGRPALLRSDARGDRTPRRAGGEVHR